ncbi:hypothetical protein BD410DRAFT_809996 [Rickenella mellea]|uniref:Uncharacterized protein n=1 Tax=Rickenella mellea TaxID=50990 RepID=A0A4Y7PGA9_9AGAM|nr:hypothetical protein BD410DRAFT_809996 [Rickenella mellea]
MVFSTMVAEKREVKWPVSKGTMYMVVTTSRNLLMSSSWTVGDEAWWLSVPMPERVKLAVHGRPEERRRALLGTTDERGTVKTVGDVGRTGSAFPMTERESACQQKTGGCLAIQWGGGDGGWKQVRKKTSGVSSSLILGNAWLGDRTDDRGTRCCGASLNLALGPCH